MSNKWSLKVFEAEESDTEEDSCRKKERSTHKKTSSQEIGSICNVIYMYLKYIIYYIRFNISLFWEPFWGRYAL